MFSFGWSEIALTIVIIVIVIGPKEIPNLLRQLGSFSKSIKKISRKSEHPRKKVVSVKSKDLDMPSDMPLLPMKFYEKIPKEDSDIVIQLQIFATLFNDTTKLRKMSNKKYKKKVAEYRSLLT